jgi:hypothetical protein
VNNSKQTPIFASQSPPNPEDFRKFQTVISSDWDGKIVKHPASFLFWLDEEHFHFLARQEGREGFTHPDSKPGVFQAELWRYDVAEFFLKLADRPTYLEFNLAPNGAWWSCIFDSRLAPAPGQPEAIPGVQASGIQESDHWEAHAKIPRRWMEEYFPLSSGTALNATFILNSPEQVFLTSGDLGDGEPDFHRPDSFPEGKLSPPA